MQTSGLLKYLCAGAKVEVIGITQDYLSPDFVVQVSVGNALHAANSTYWHKDRRLYLSVVGGHESGSGIRKRVSVLQQKGHTIYYLTIYYLRFNIVISFIKCKSDRILDIFL